MLKKRSNINKRKIIITSLLIALAVLFVPIILSYILGLLLTSEDFYLLTGLSFCIFGCIIIMVMSIIFFLLVSEKNNRKRDLKKWFNKYTAFFTIAILVILTLETIVGYRGYIYFKDIIEGPQEAIMMNAVVKRKNSYRSNYLYIVGNIDGEEIKLKITQDAKEKVSHGKSYKMVKIGYYKNIKEIYDIIITDL